jgi:hypothetical protein
MNMAKVSWSVTLSLEKESSILRARSVLPMSHGMASTDMRRMAGSCFVIVRVAAHGSPLPDEKGYYEREIAHGLLDFDKSLLKSDGGESRWTCPVDFVPQGVMRPTVGIRVGRLCELTQVTKFTSPAVERNLMVCGGAWWFR